MLLDADAPDQVLRSRVGDALEHRGDEIASLLWAGLGCIGSGAEVVGHIRKEN